MTSTDPNLGLEGLANGPDFNTSAEAVAAGGGRLFYTGMQEDGHIFVFRLSPTSNAVEFLMEKASGSSGISDMFYDERFDILWVHKISFIQNI